MVRTKKSSPDRSHPRGRGGSRLILALALGLTALATPSFAADDPLLSRMAGDWIGRGTFKSSPTAEPELVYCKVTNTLVQSGAALQQKGRCAVATNSGRVTGKFEAKGDGVYLGSLESLSTKGPATLTGKASDNQITFNAQFVDNRTKKSGEASIQLAIGDSQYRVVSTTLGQKADFVASDIKFSKQ